LGDFVMLSGSEALGDLVPGQIGTITRDDHDSTPYRVDDKGYWCGGVSASRKIIIPI